MNLCWLLVDLFWSSSQPSKNKSINFELWICFDFLWSGAPPSKNESNRSLLLFFDVCWSGAPPSKNKSACIMLGLFNPCLPLAHVLLCPYSLKSCLVTAFLQIHSTVVVLLPTQCLPAYLTGPLMFFYPIQTVSRVFQESFSLTCFSCQRMWWASMHIEQAGMVGALKVGL